MLGVKRTRVASFPWERKPLNISRSTSTSFTSRAIRGAMRRLLSSPSGSFSAQHRW